MHKTLPLLSLLVLSSCSGVRYEKNWTTALSKPAKGISGCWEGKWISEANGHTGALQCVVSQVSDKPNHYLFHYRATWVKILRAAFTIECAAKQGSNGTWTVSGEKDLGPAFGGVFSHTATITQQALQARYSAKLDRGKMELIRPPVPSESATR